MPKTIWELALDQMNLKVDAQCRGIYNWCLRSNGAYAMGWPSCFSAYYANPTRIVYGTFLLRPEAVEWEDIPDEHYYKHFDQINFLTKLMYAKIFAQEKGYVGGFPSFQESYIGDKKVIRTHFFKEGTCESDFVPSVVFFNDPSVSWDDPWRVPVYRWYQASDKYAQLHKIGGAMPTGDYIEKEGSIWLEVLRFPKDKVEWRDIRGRELNLPDSPFSF